MDKKEMLDCVKFSLSGFSKIGAAENKILKAINKVDRKKFVSSELKTKAYLDIALPTKLGQTISQPSTVARILQLLNLKKGDSVLEIGTGSGWNACLIAEIIKPGKVLTTEIFKKLAEEASANLEKLKIKNVEIIIVDFKEIRGKFDKIVFTAGIESQQENIIISLAKRSLADKGILVCPYRTGPLIIVNKDKNELIKTLTKEEYVFVPLLN